MNNMCKSLIQGVKKHQPEILVGLGVGGFIFTAITAVRVTPKALKLIEQEKERINQEIEREARIRQDDNYPVVDRLKPLDVVKVTWKCYIPPLIMGIASASCIIGAHSINARRSAALATAYSISESALKEYRAKLIETEGEEKDREIRSAIAKDKVEQNPVESREVFVMGNGDQLCYDPYSGRYFMSTREKLERAINEMSYQMLNKSYASLNDFYEEIGLESTKTGYDVGWHIQQGALDLSLSSQIATDGRPCIVLDFITAPDYNYDRWL